MVHNPLPEDPAVLVLADGTVFKGKAAGSRGTSFGEIAFNTGMYGYQEIFTDPSYHRQIVVMATAHIGNYGVHEDETESSGPRVAGVVVRNFSPLQAVQAATEPFKTIWRDMKSWASGTWTRALW